MPAPMPAVPKTLLIVEDEILPAMALRDELQDAGYVVMDLTKRHGEAIGAAKACKPDLALVNIELQGQDTGIDIARDLKAMGIPVLFISGQVSSGAVRRNGRHRHPSPSPTALSRWPWLLVTSWPAWQATRVMSVPRASRCSTTNSRPRRRPPSS